MKPRHRRRYPEPPSAAPKPRPFRPRPRKWRAFRVLSKNLLGTGQPRLAISPVPGNEDQHSQHRDKSTNSRSVHALLPFYIPAAALATRRCFLPSTRWISKPRGSTARSPCRTINSDWIIPYICTLLKRESGKESRDNSENFASSGWPGARAPSTFSHRSSDVGRLAHTPSPVRAPAAFYHSEIPMETALHLTSPRVESEILPDSNRPEAQRQRLRMGSGPGKWTANSTISV